MPATTFCSLLHSILAQTCPFVSISSFQLGLVAQLSAVSAKVVTSSLGHMVHHGHLFFGTYGASCSSGALHKIVSAINWGTSTLASTKSPMSPRMSHTLCGTHRIQFANGQTHEMYSQAWRNCHSSSSS